MRRLKDGLVFDRASVRRKDADGHLFIEVTPISKSNICGYLGSEIPGSDQLGLQPDKVYQLLRDPVALEESAPTFAGKPILLQHIPISADDHPRDKVVGAIGDAVKYEAPYLMASLSVWAAEAIDLIESGKQRELSCAYRYEPVMDPGTWEGKPYDGRMTKIEANHLALVETGRAGPDVIVADSAITQSEETVDMATKPVVLTRKAAVAKGALLTYLRPKLAADAKIDLSSVLAGITAKNFVEKKPTIIAGVTKLVTGKLAKDAKLEDMHSFLDSLDKEEAAEEAAAMDDDPEDVDAMDEGPLREFLKGKGMADDDVNEACGMMKRKATDAMDPKADPKPDPKAEDEDDDKKDDKKKMVTKSAMDAALKKAQSDAEASTMKRLQDIRAAERAVAPLIGEVTLGLDSADAIYRAALKANDVDVKGVDPSAFPALVAMLNKNKVASAKPNIRIAHDAAPASERAEFDKAHGIPARRIRNLGA